MVNVSTSEGRLLGNPFNIFASIGIDSTDVVHAVFTWCDSRWSAETNCAVGYSRDFQPAVALSAFVTGNEGPQSPRLAISPPIDADNNQVDQQVYVAYNIWTGDGRPGDGMWLLVGNTNGDFGTRRRVSTLSRKLWFQEAYNGGLAVGANGLVIVSATDYGASQFLPVVAISTDGGASWFAQYPLEGTAAQPSDRIGLFPHTSPDGRSVIATTRSHINWGTATYAVVYHWRGDNLGTASRSPIAITNRNHAGLAGSSLGVCREAALLQHDRIGPFSAALSNADGASRGGSPPLWVDSFAGHSSTRSRQLPNGVRP